MENKDHQIEQAIKICEAELVMREKVFAKRDPKLLSDKVTEMVLVINLLKTFLSYKLI